MTLPLEKLKAVTTLVTHANCADGLASAMIVKDVLPDVEILFQFHNTPEHLGLEAKPGMLFCDFTPPKERAEEFRAAGAIVLDHHTTAKGLVLSFGDNGVFADEKASPGVSGAVLAYEYVWVPLAGPAQRIGYHKSVQRFAELVGVRDTWQKHDPRWEEALVLTEALHFFPADVWLGPGGMPSVRDGYASRLATAELVLQRRRAKIEAIAKTAVRFTAYGGLKVILAQGVTITSDLAERLRDEADIIGGFLFQAGEGLIDLQLQYSLRAGASGFDVGKFAAFNGGGGHSAAAGFRVPDPDMSLNPYDALRAILADYLNPLNT
jgi:hypothetical protein